MNRPLSAARHAAPPDAPPAAPGREPDETLVVDPRAGLTPTDAVERTLCDRLRGGPVSASHVRMGPARGRGRAAEAPAAESGAPRPGPEAPLPQETRAGPAVADANRRRPSQSREPEVELSAIRGPEAPPCADRRAEGQPGRGEP